MKVIGYVRVSTKKQENNTSIDLQKEIIQNYCNLYNHELLEIISDVKSGSQVENRNLKALLDKVNNSSDIEGIIIHKLDRLSRNLKDGLNILHSFDKNNKALISITEQYDFSTSQGKLMFESIFKFIEYDYKITKERLSSGKKAVKKMGGFIGGGVKLGKKVETKTINKKEIKVLVDNDQEMQVIKVIKNHKRSGKSLYQIMQYLNKNGYKTKKDKQFTISTIKGVLQNNSKKAMK
jgi:site-specific DNA recombinase